MIPFLIILSAAFLWYRIGDRTEGPMPPRSNFPPRDRWGRR